MHVSLAEEISVAKENLKVESGEHNLKDKWLNIFHKCFHRLDNEVGGFATTDGVPTAPESVGSTAAVAIVCSTHIIVANCGDSRAVLNRGKVPMPLSTDHKVVILILSQFKYYLVHTYALSAGLNIIIPVSSQIEKTNVQG